MRILVSGSTGLIGRAVVAHLRAKGHEVVRLMRREIKPTADAISWNPDNGGVNPRDFDGFDAVVHLAGENISSHRWTKKKKERLFTSRARDTWLLSQALLRAKPLPRAVICASAIGYYGNRGDELLTEESGKGEGFLADLCDQWELATRGLESSHCRVVHARFGAVLSKEGGMLAQMIPTFRCGLGGRFGSGKQYISWIALEDVVQGIDFLLAQGEMRGIVNLVAPKPVRQKEFADTLASVLHRPAFLWYPGWLLHIMLGEIADEAILSSQNALPKRLQESGFSFRYRDLRSLLLSQV